MRNFIPLLRHFASVFKHKYYVFLAGVKTKTPIWQLIVHDFSKLSLAEAPAYARKFFGGNSDPLGFEYAWLHHQNTNPHHWHYWVQRGRYHPGQDVKPWALPMPMKYVREMVADWMAASLRTSGQWPESLESWQWYHKNKDQMILHELTKERLDIVLKEVFYSGA